MEPLLGNKAEASGFPTGFRTHDHKESYIKAFYESEGVQLDCNFIRPNAAMRGITKLCLNSMSGKLFFILFNIYLFVEKHNVWMFRFFTTCFW
jgi:hypothetical protein